jgi:hypothetical protein
MVKSLTFKYADTVTFRIGKVSRVTWYHVTPLVQNRSSGCQCGQSLTQPTTTNLLSI